MDFFSVVKKRQTLEAKKELILEREKQLRDEVAEAKARLSYQPEIKELLEKLQQIEHSKSVGTYEKLLGALLEDILPGERKAILDLYTEKGLPGLDIYIQKGNRPYENALRGTGGSIKNILSIGLRMIALIKSDRRKFLVLDESDCWLEPKWVPKMAMVVQALAERLKIQVLMISHHDESLFADIIPYRLKLMSEYNSAEEQEVSVMWSPTSSEPVWEKEQDGLRNIALTNFQAHKNTIVPLSPYVTLLQGTNDSGKSSIVSALRATFEEESDDTMIRHGESYSRVDYDFGPLGILSWMRFEKGKFKVSYEHFNLKGESIERHTGSKESPPWLLKTFGIGSIDEFDVQLTPQTKPIFLLTEPASKRAQALAIGNDAHYIQRMIACYKEDVQKDKQTVKQGEAELDRIMKQKKILEALVPLDKDFVVVQQEIQTLTNRIDSMDEFYVNWKTSKQKQDIFSQLNNSNFSTELKSPTSHIHLGFLSKWMENFNVYNILLNYKKNSKDITPYEAVNFEKLKTCLSIFSHWTKENKVNQVLSNKKMQEVKPVEIDIDISMKKSFIKHWMKEKCVLDVLNQLSLDKTISIPIFSFNQHKNFLHSYQVAFEESKNIHSEKTQADKEIAELEKTIGEEFKSCPTCHREFDCSHTH